MSFLDNCENIVLRDIELDFMKNDDFGFGKKYKVRHVPTILVLKDGEEVGRIVEKAKKSYEADILMYLKKSDDL